MANTHDLPKTEVADLCGKSGGPWKSWESLQQVIKDTFEEADHLIAHDSIRHQHRGNSHSRRTRPTMREITPVHTSPPIGCDKAARDIQVFRRPQHEDEYWSVSSKGWSKLSEARREVLSHVGRINETSEGQEAPGGDCKKCAESGSDCMVYCEGARKKHNPLDGVSACSRCRFRGVACSFLVAGKAAAKERKAGSSGTGSHLVKKTRLQ